MSQKRTHATTAYIMKMKPYMMVLALNPDEGEEAFPMFPLVELLVSSDWLDCPHTGLSSGWRSVVRGGVTPLAPGRKLGSILIEALFLFF